MVKMVTSKTIAASVDYRRIRYKTSVNTAWSYSVLKIHRMNADLISVFQWTQTNQWGMNEKLLKPCGCQHYFTICHSISIHALSLTSSEEHSGITKPNQTKMLQISIYLLRIYAWVASTLKTEQQQRFCVVLDVFSMHYFFFFFTNIFY